jgi:hypothetical protein
LFLVKRHRPRFDSDCQTTLAAAVVAAAAAAAAAAVAAALRVHAEQFWEMYGLIISVHYSYTECSYINYCIYGTHCSCYTL